MAAFGLKFLDDTNDSGLVDREPGVDRESNRIEEPKCEGLMDAAGLC